MGGLNESHSTSHNCCHSNQEQTRSSTRTMHSGPYDSKPRRYGHESKIFAPCDPSSICIFLLSLGLCAISLGFAASLSPTTPCESLLQLNGPFDHEGAIAFPVAARLFQNKRVAGLFDSSTCRDGCIPVHDLPHLPPVVDEHKIHHKRRRGT